MLLRLLLAVLAAAVASTLLTSPAAAATRPNVLFIVTDDQRINTLGVMPETQRIFGDEGTHFPNAFATTPTCCPSRSSILTGLYAHNHGVKDNNQASMLDHERTLERILDRDDYRTGIFGKFLNHWTITQNPPYFDKWSIFNNGPYASFRVNEQGVIKTIPQYATTYVAQKAVEFIEQAESSDGRPWFLYVAPTAPHEPFNPEGRYAQATVPEFVPNPAYFEPDRSDKPHYVQEMAVDPGVVSNERTAQLRMLMSVDDLVADVFSTLEANGENNRTLAFFVSDNGYMWGEHGLKNKAHAYTHSTKIPMYMRWPGRVSAGAVDSRLAANIDLAPTTLDAADITPTRAQDGISLLTSSSRSRLLLERLSRQAGGPPTWAAVRTPSYQYTEYYAGGVITYVEDSSAPAGPKLNDSDPESPANENSPKIKGNADIGTTVRLYRAPTTADCTPANLVATGSPATLVSPGIEVSVPDDSTTRFRAIATDRAGNRSPCSASSLVYTEDSTSPAAPTLTDTDPDSPANNNSPRVKGTAETGSTVRIYEAPTNADCTPANLVATGTAANFASPGLQVSVADNSTTRFRATATDSAGNLSSCSGLSIVYTEDSSPPAQPTLTGSDPGSPANDNNPRLKGTAATGSTVRIYRAPSTSGCTSGNLVATGPVQTFATTGLQVSVPDNSTTRFRATATDQAGNSSGCSSSSIVYEEDSTPPPQPTLTDTDPNSPANDNSPRVKGSATAASTVRVYKAPGTAGCTAANLVAAGSPAAFAAPGLAASVADNSTTRFRAIATDQAGNSSGCSASSIVYVEDSIAPTAPGLADTDPNSPANDNAPRVKGTAAPGATVRLYRAPTNTGCTAANLAATGTAADFISPGLQVSVADNSTTRFRATATDQAGNASACSSGSIVYSEDSTPPGAPTLTDTDPDSPANHNLPRVKGTAAVDSTVRLYRATTTTDCTPANLAATGPAAEFASPGFQVAVADESTTRLRAVATDKAGNSSACSTSFITYTEDSTPPAEPALTATDPPSPANENFPRITGSAASGSTVLLYRAATSADCTAANLAASGSAAQLASPGIQVSVPDNSTTTFRATATDTAGNTSGCSASIDYTEDSTPAPLRSTGAFDKAGFALAALSGEDAGTRTHLEPPPEPTVTDTDPGSPANDNTPNVRGTAAAESTVRLFTDPDCTGPVAATGTAAEFSSVGIAVSVPDDSTTTFRATATNLHSTSSACSSSSVDYTEDSTAPPAPDLTDTDPDPPANDNSPRVKGDAQAGSTVHLYTTADCSGAVAASGSAAQFSSPGLAVSVADDSTTTFYAAGMDAAGNTSACSTSSIDYTEDSTAPPAPDLTDTDPDPPANDNSPRVKGNAQAGSTVLLYTTADCSGAVAASGFAAQFSSPGLAVSVPDDSTTRFRATATDQAGNTSACSSSIDYTEDSTAPPGPDLTDTDPDPPANDNTPMVKGSAAAGTTVRLYTDADCSSAVSATGTAAQLSSSGIAVSVPDDTTTTFRAIAADQAGNTSACSSSFGYSEDSTPPDLPLFTDTDPDSPANDNSPLVKGTADAGSTVRLYKAPSTTDCIAANLVATGSPAKFSSPGFPASVADDSVTSFRASATDSAGNTSGCSISTIAYIEDSTAPAPPKLTTTSPGSPANDNTPRVKGTSTTGTIVRVYTTGDCSGAVSAVGSAATFASAGLEVSVPDDSTTTFRATATDQAANVSPCSGTELAVDQEPVFREYYDLASDPWELTNPLGDEDTLNDPPAQTLQSLHDQLLDDLNCAGRGNVSGRPACP